ncbi:MAG: phage holin family protein [Actinomycetes bacterium]|nr:MAG: hypothetical protein DIU73_00970 [Actinomycetota bacterium]
MKTSSLVSSIVNALLTALAGRVTLVLKTEYNNAKEEVRVKAKHLSIGIASLAIATAFAFLVLIALVLAAFLALTEIWAPWLAALVVAGGTAFFALVFGIIGAVKVNKNKNLMPEKAINNVKAYIGK